MRAPNIWQIFKQYGASLSLLLVMALTLTGCIHEDRSVKLNSDGSGSYTLTLGFLDDLLTAGGDSLSSPMDQYGAQVKQAGGSYRKYDDNSYTYWAYTEPFSDISKLNAYLASGPTTSDTSSASLPTTGISSADTVKFTEQSGMLTNTFHVTGHLSLAIPDGTDTSGVDLTQYLKDMRDSFAVTMPGWVTAHTGGTINGNTVSYSISGGQQADIDVTGVGLTTLGYAAIAVGAVIILALIGLIVFLIVRRSRPKTPKPEPVTAGVAAYGFAAPGAPTPTFSSNETIPPTPAIEG
jgi:hypothetical protein